LTHIFPPHWRAEQARTIIYKPYASTEFTLNKYNEFAGGSIVFSSNPVCICALYRIKKKKGIGNIFWQSWQLFPGNDFLKSAPSLLITHLQLPFILGHGYNLLTLFWLVADFLVRNPFID
jgi:hypothetical protein